LARFTADIAVDWVYPQHPYPVIFDCYALNVVGEAAYTCAYTTFHVVSVHGSRVTDHGVSPHRGGFNLLVHGRDGAFVGGYGAEYDQVTPIQFTPDGVVTAGNPRRLVLPDGMEIRNVRYTCRGPDLHAIIGNVWYRSTIDNLIVEPAQAPAP
jgi:hypothetical protein